MGRATPNPSVEDKRSGKLRVQPDHRPAYEPRRFAAEQVQEFLTKCVPK